MNQRVLFLLLADAKPRFAVKIEIGFDVIGLQLLEASSDAGLEGVRLALRGFPDFSQKVSTALFAFRDPWMVIRQNCFGHSEVLRELTNFVCEGFEVLDFLQLRKSSSVVCDLGGVILEVL